MTVDDIFDALYLQAKDQIGLTKLRDIVLTDESINRLQFHGAGQEPIIFIKERHGHWIEEGLVDGNQNRYCRCSECGFVRDAYVLEEKTYCPRCGADMQEVENG